MTSTFGLALGVDCCANKGVVDPSAANAISAAAVYTFGARMDKLFM
jgi:hypothetical protein